MKRAFSFMFFMLCIVNLFSQSIDKQFKEFSDKIFPLVKVEVKDDKEALIPEADRSLYKKVVGDLVCFYVIDRDTHFEFLSRQTVPASISIDSLERISIRNMEREINTNLYLQETPFGGYTISIGGVYEAALITMPSIWKLLVDKLGSSIVFAVPSKDVVMFVASDNTNGIAETIDLVNQIHANGVRLRSKQLFKYENGVLSTF